jgi:tRNA(Ile)-lysidine synthase
VLKKFQTYLKKNNLCSVEDKILVAVSGGVDSMVLAHLFIEAGYKIAVATCNHGLRGEESEADKRFVIEYFSSMGIEVFSTDLNVSDFSTQQQLGTQEAARVLRYEYLLQLSDNQNFTHLSTAHHLNDNVETVLFNFANKTGIRGLTGIDPMSKRGNIQLIRPLLFADKATILAYSKVKKIPFREDASNASDKYSRNFIRHQVVPNLEKINSGFLKNASDTIQYLNEYEQILNFFIEKIKKEALSEVGNLIKIEVEVLMKYPSPTTLLYEIIKNYGFNSAQSEEIVQSLQLCHKGKMWHSKTHRLLNDRNFIFIKKDENKIIKNIDSEILIHFENNEFIFSQGKLSIEKATEIPVTFPNNANVIFLDVTQLVFPLRLRSWQAGDFFLPLGLSGKRKKVQDFFTDQKFNLFQKEETMLLESDGQIVWVIGWRADHRFRIIPSSTSILKITFIAQ